jgi:signal peptidase II
MNAMNWMRTLVVTALLVGNVACDQATKRVAKASLQHAAPITMLGGTIRLQYAENPGAFLSLGAAMPPVVRRVVFTGAVGVMLLWMLVAAYVMQGLRWSRISALALVAGGGLSNWLDRLLQDGRVVDFLNVGIGPVRTGIFNVADVAIMAGAALLAWPSPKPPVPPETAPPPPAAPAPA